MSAALQRIQQLAQQVADVGIDMSQVSKGGQGRRLLPAGNALGRFVLYREFGEHAREYQGKAKAPAMEVRLGFLLWGKGDPQGPDAPENLYHRVDEGGVVRPGFIESFGMSLGNNERSKTKIAFDKLNYKGTAKRFIELLNETYIIPIKVVQPKKADGKPRNEINWAGILPARDPITAQPYGVPAAEDSDFKVFLWDAPHKEDWDAMFIEGVNDKGQSKNFLQARCLEAVNFEGSLLQQMLGGELPDLTGGVEGDGTDEDDDTPAPVAAVPAVPGVVAPSAAPVVPDVPFDGAVPSTMPPAAAMAPVATAPVVPSVPSVPSVPGVPAAFPGVPT